MPSTVPRTGHDPGIAGRVPGADGNKPARCRAGIGVTPASLYNRGRSASRQRPAALVLAVVCVAQFMVVLDISIVNVALPSMKSDLHMSQNALGWVLNAYTLTFAGFLLLGGRAADLWGRRRLFLIGVGAVLADLAARRPGADRRRADRRPGPAGPRRRRALAGHADDPHHDLHRTAGPRPGARHVERGRRRRRRHRRAGRRRADRPAVLALDPVHQRPDRHPRADRRPLRHRRVARPRASGPTLDWAGARHRSPAG